MYNFNVKNKIAKIENYEQNLKNIVKNSKKTAKKQQKTQKMLGIYIHIPFCEKKCDYCNFVSFCKSNDEKISYIEALKKEIVLQSSSFCDYIVDTIFVGGGTPSCLFDGAIKDIFDCLKNNFKISKDCETTIECNPNSITETKLEEYKSVGVNRLSVGLQVYDDKLLKLIGRLHTKKQFDDAIKLCKNAGFENINVDLILGIPKQKMHSVKKELSHLTKLGINHISAYGLIVEENTKLAKNLENNVYKLPSEKLQVKMYDYTKKYLQKHEIFRYEVSNFAKVGFESKHNLKYWNNGEYLGLGLTSSSYVDCKRWKNTDDFNQYICKINKNILPKEEVELIDKNEQIEECIMLSLRTAKGIDLKQFEKQFGFDLLVKKRKEIEFLQEQNFVQIQNNQFFCTDLGFKLLNQVILSLID